MKASIRIGLVGLVICSNVAVAQSSAQEQGAWELRIASGAFVPTGAQRNSLSDAQMTAAQVSWLVRPSAAVTGTFAWARTRDVALPNTPKLDAFASDLGIEARGGQWFRDCAMTFDPFVGVGAGARSYNYRNMDVEAAHNLAGYGEIGGELGVRRVGLRVEVRDYVSGFRPLVGVGHAETRNDVVVMVGLRFKRQHAAQN
jgi:hypothetical protein